MSSFKQKYSLEQRRDEVDRILVKYPARAPIICERHGTNLPILDKTKYLVPLDLSVGQFIYVIRKRLTLAPEKALFLFINNQLPCGADTIGTVYHNHRDTDGFLYINYSGENTFG